MNGYDTVGGSSARLLIVEPDSTLPNSEYYLVCSAFGSTLAPYKASADLA